jgi:hypothetical protein
MIKPFSSKFLWGWLVLAHVCQRWRQITFASPRRLNLQIICRHKSPVRANLDIWPAIPINVDATYIKPDNDDNVIAALEHPNRVCRIWLAIPTSHWQFGRIATVMQKPFPVLTSLSIASESRDSFDIPCELLGGSAPRLQQIELDNVSFPALPKLLLSAKDLVELSLRKIPPTGCISPEVMVAHLAMSPRLNILHIEFHTITSHPAQALLPSITQIVLPALHDLSFTGVWDYLEDLMARMDTPQLDSLVIAYDYDLNIEVPQLTRFVSRSAKLKQIMSNQCKLVLNYKVDFGIYDTTGRYDPYISVGFSGSIYEQFYELTRVISSISPILSDMVHLDIDSDALLSDPLSPAVEEVDAIRWTEWLALFRPFSSMKGLSVSWQFAGHVACALEDMTMTATEVLPALELLCLEYTEDSRDKPVSFINDFITARRDSGHPVTITGTQRTFDRRLRFFL